MLPFDEQPLDQAHFLRVIGKVLPQDYLAQLAERPDSGYELFLAVAAMGERLGLALNRAKQGAYALHAQGGARSTGIVTVTRTITVDTIDFVLQAGSTVSTSDGRVYRTLRDATYSGADTSHDVAIEAVADGWEYDVRGTLEATNGDTLPGLIDRVVFARTLPAFADTTLTAANAADVAGGRAPMLDLVAADRGVTRAPNETDESLGFRARTLPDTVSPGAVLRLLHALLDPYGIPFALVETFQHSYQECWDAPSLNPGTPTYQATPPTNPNFDTNTFVYDDPRDPDLTFRNRWMDLREFRACFIVVIDRRFTLRDLGFAYDDPGILPTDFHPTIGRPSRQTPAYDVTSSMPPEVIYGPAYDGFDIDQRALIAALWNSLQQIRAAGVAAIIEYVRP